MNEEKIVKHEGGAEILPAQTSEGHLVPYVPSGNYRLTPAQKRAAQAIVANEMLPKKKGIRKKTYIEIADELGVHRDTLLNWRTLPDFRRFVQDMTMLSIGDMQSMAVARLYELANGDQTGTSSVKAIEMILEMNGILKKKQEINVTTNSGNDLKHVSDAELDALISEYDDEEDSE